MGDIKIPIIVVRKGICGRLNPSAANVPRPVANAVENTAIMTLFFTAPCQLALVKKSSYQRSEYPVGSNVSIFGVKVKYGTALNDNGTITINGAIKKKNTNAHSVRNV